MPRTSQPIKVLIVDDQRTFGEALSLALSKEKDLRVLDVVTDGDSAVRASERQHPDVVLMDLAMPGMDGIETTRRIVEEDSDARVILLTGHVGDLTTARAVQAGATGCLPKTEAVIDLAGAVRRAHAGEPLLDPEEVEASLRRLRHRRAQEATVEQRLERLTPRELEILQLIADGVSSEKIAPSLGVSPHTLRTHLQNVLTKLKVHSKLDAVVLAIRHGKIRANLDTAEAVEAAMEEGDLVDVAALEETVEALEAERNRRGNGGANEGGGADGPARAGRIRGA
jgi:two-component system, NarL family, response regulator LiaR